jgi:hypothetical protein
MNDDGRDPLATLRQLIQMRYKQKNRRAEASTHTFLCLPCGKAATTYQQT